jgi:predicted nucleic acid-binding Zn ribbon protein
VEKVGKILGDSLPQRSMDVAAPTTSGDKRTVSRSTRATVIQRSAVVSEHQESLTVTTSASQGESSAVPRRRRRLGVRTDLTKVRAILSAVLTHRGLDKRVERYEFILHWPEIVGERLAEVSKPEYIRDKALVVQVLHPAWAQELTMIKPVLLESLAQYLKPGDIVRDMVFRVAAFDRMQS